MWIAFGWERIGVERYLGWGIGVEWVESIAKPHPDALTTPQCAHHKAPHTKACPSPRLAQPRVRPSSAPRISDHIALHTNPRNNHNPRNTNRPQHTNRSTSQSFVVCPCRTGDGTVQVRSHNHALRRKCTGNPRMPRLRKNSTLLSCASSSGAVKPFIQS